MSIKRVGETNWENVNIGGVFTDGLVREIFFLNVEIKRNLYYVYKGEENFP